MIKSILIVDDNKPNRELLKAILLPRQYKLYEAIDGKDAIAKAIEYKPDLIFMDIQLPVMDGTEALKLLQANPETANIPTIALTSYAMKNDKEKLLGMGFKAYIAKPIDIDEIYNVLSVFDKK